MIKPASEALATDYKEALANDYAGENARNYDKTTKAFKQCTLKRSVQAIGKGRFGHQPSRIILRPAPSNTGILFRRVDMNPIPMLEMEPQCIYTTAMQTNLISNNIGVYGIEHLISALAGLGIDNLLIDIDTSEMPIMDGSAEPFVFLIQSAGLKHQSALKRFLRIKEKVQITTHDAWVSVEPSEAFQVTCTLSCSDKTMLDEQYSITLSTSIYTKSLSRARDHTAYGSSNQRYTNEAIRHHVLDNIGDFYTLGYSVLGNFRSYNTDHTLNHRLTQKLLANPKTWELVEHPFQLDNRAEFTYS